MLDLGRYLLGVAEIAVLVGFAWLGATALRRRLLPGFEGTPAFLATAVVACAILLWTAELLGSFGLFKPLPYLALTVVWGLALQVMVGGGWGRPSVLLGFSPGEAVAGRGSGWGEKQDAAASEGRPHPPATVTLVALAIGALAVVKFGWDAKPNLTTGMTGFDSTWYHGPFAAGFAQTGDTWGLHFIAPQFLAWFYPANSEVFHGVGMLAFGRDLLSPLLNIGWFVGCLVACWCIGRPYKVAPASLILGAVALSLPVLGDQAGEARNDIVGIFFLLSAVALLLNAWAGPNNPFRCSFAAHNRTKEQRNLGAVAVVGLAAGLAAGTKLNFLLPAAVLVVGVGLIAEGGTRIRVGGVALLGALAGGGYWHLRNLAQTGNPLPWVKDIGPISLPAPEQALGGREGHSVLGYLTDGTAWADWLLPGLHSGLTILWPLLLAATLAGLLLALSRRADPALRLAGAVGLAALAAWLIAPTSASGPEGVPRGFQSGLRYLAPALVLGLALLPATPRLTSCFGMKSHTKRQSQRFRWGVAVAVGFALVAIAIGYPIQRHYLDNRYEAPTFAAPGLNAAFGWAQGVEDARIATTSTRQYPLFGRDLSNEVEYLGERRPHGGFVAPSNCRAFRALVNRGGYDYLVASRDRVEAGRPAFPDSARWAAGPATSVVLREPPTVVFRLDGRLDPRACPP